VITGAARSGDTLERATAPREAAGGGIVSIGWDAHRRPATTLLEAIGQTPLVRLGRVSPEGVELLAKVAR